MLRFILFAALCTLAVAYRTTQLELVAYDPQASPSSAGFCSLNQFLAAVDVTGDGIIDIVGVNVHSTSHGFQRDLGLCRGLGSGEFAADTVIASTGEFNDAFSAATPAILEDLNGDGALDIVVSGNVSHTFVYLNDGAGGFAVSAAVGPQFGGELTWWQVADVDGDGDADIYYSAGAHILWDENMAGDGLHWRRHSLDGSVVDDTLVFTINAPVYAMDVDNDGVKDFVILDLTTFTLGWYRGLGAGLFDPFLAVANVSGCLPGSAQLSPEVTLDASSTPAFLFTCTERIVGAYNSLAIAFEHTTTAPYFTARFLPNIQCALPSGRVYKADLNADGWVDLLGPAGETWLANRGDGSGFDCFGSATWQGGLTYGGQHLSLNGVLDLDGDGWQDLVFGASWPFSGLLPESAWYRNTGTPCQAGTCGDCDPFKTCGVCNGHLVSSVQDAASCVACPLGSGSNRNATGCVVCTPGTYSNNSFCDVCPAGMHAEDGNSSTCALCDAGTIPDAHSIECTPCSPGRFTNDSITCFPCARGTWAPRGSAVCAPCEPGYIADVGQGVCLICPPGTYSTDSTTCRACPPESMSLTAGASECAPCNGCSLGANALQPPSLHTTSIAHYTQPPRVQPDSERVDRIQVALMITSAVILGAAGLLLLCIEQRYGPATSSSDCLPRFDMCFKAAHIGEVLPSPLIRRTTHAGGLMTLAVTLASVLLVAGLGTRYAQDNVLVVSSQLPALTLDFPAATMVINITLLGYGGACGGANVNGSLGCAGTILGMDRLSATTCSWSDIPSRACSFIATCDSCVLDLTNYDIAFAATDPSAYAAALVYNFSLTTGTNHVPNWAGGQISSATRDTVIQGCAVPTLVELQTYLLTTTNESLVDDNQYVIGVSTWTRGSVANATTFVSSYSPGVCAHFSLARDSFYVHTVLSAKQSFMTFAASAFGMFSGILVVGKTLLTLAEITHQRWRNRSSARKKLDDEKPEEEEGVDSPALESTSPPAAARQSPVKATPLTRLAPLAPIVAPGRSEQGVAEVPTGRRKVRVKRKVPVGGTQPERQDNGSSSRSSSA